MGWAELTTDIEREVEREGERREGRRRRTGREREGERRRKGEREHLSPFPLIFQVVLACNPNTEGRGR